MNSITTDPYSYYMNLPQGNRIQAEYIWIGALTNDGCDIRSKTRTLDKEVQSLDDLPIWNYDGSSTNQAPGTDSEVYLKPIAVYRDPFRTGKNVLVLCESCMPDVKLTPIPSNTRRICTEVMNKAASHRPWFGIEQEYTLMQKDSNAPLGWPAGGFPAPQGPYYCSVGVEKAFGRRIVDAHYRACLFAGIKIAGCNSEVMPGQWEFQVGPCEGIEAGDHLVVARYILLRVCEDFGVRLSLDPKPVSGDWNGAGCHTNFSTIEMRSDNGYPFVLKAIDKLEKKHNDHIDCYGVGNERRLTGAHETAPIHKFSFGVANRGASVRIPRDTFLKQKGYIEDRRPASNMDPYIVTARVVLTILLEEHESKHQENMSTNKNSITDVDSNLNSSSSTPLLSIASTLSAAANGDLRSTKK